MQKSSVMFLFFLLVILASLKSSSAVTFQAGKISFNASVENSVICQDVTFPSTFISSGKVLVHVSLSHGDKFLKVHDPAALWVTLVTTSGFTVCMRETGRGSNGTAVINWVALVDTGSNNGLSKGIISFENWAEGVKCKQVTFSQPFVKAPSVFVTAVHPNTKGKHNAMNVWVDNIKNDEFKVCMRESTTFDGVHKNLNVNWFAFDKVQRSWNFTESHKIVFNNNKNANALLSENNKALCQVINFTNVFYQPPVVIISPITNSSVTPASCNAVSTWIEEVTNNSFRLCMKDIQSSSSPRDLVTVQYVVIGDHTCDPNANVVNSTGSYNCTCKPRYTGYGQTCAREKYDWALEDHIIVTHKVPNEAWCYGYCVNDKWKRCRSLNFQKKNNNDKYHLCEINYSTKTRHPGSMRKRPGWVYEETEDADELPLLAPVAVKTNKVSLVVEEDSKTIIYCGNATGHPKPTIEWQKYGRFFSSERNVTFKRVHLLDDGLYTCNATNILNTALVRVMVTVVPKIRFVKTPPREVEAAGGSRIHLDCTATRLSYVTWYRKNGNDLSKENQLSTNGPLVLFNVSYSTSGVYICNASTQFRSISATTHVKVHYLSCSHLKAVRPTESSGNYYLNPDGKRGKKGFVAYCDMNDKGGVGVTVIGHNRETTEHLTRCLGSDCLRHTVKYTGFTLAQLSSLTAVSSYCEQFIMFVCNGNVNFIYEREAWWVSRDGIAMNYWGGATQYSGSCACGMTKTCHNGGFCNCKSRPWFFGLRNDSGFLTDKFNLPVTQIRFGQSSWASYSLGKFRCYGVISVTDYTCDPNAYVINTAGSYTCTCKPGYTGNGQTCARETYRGLNTSAILGNNVRYQKQLDLWLFPVLRNSSRSRWVRCWSGKSDGFGASTFHSQCDSRGPTVTIVQVGIYVFGGYTDKSWTSAGRSYTSYKSFLFTLYNTYGYRPQKLTIYRHHSHAIYGGSRYGPGFSYDLRIRDHANTMTGSLTYSGYTYYAPYGCSHGGSLCSVLAGSSFFLLSDIEVFYKTF